MKTEENKRMLALSCIVADLKAENMELVKHMQNISSEFADVLCRLNEKEKRMNECSSAQTLVELRQMQEQCDKPERENRELKRFAKGIQSFVKDKNLFMKKDMECPYHPGGVSVCSTSCLECNLCLGVLDGIGVICEEKLRDPCVAPTTDD